MREGQFVTTWKEAQEEMARPVRWPTVMVDSYEFGKLPHYERFRQLAWGYLRSAKSLCLELGEHPDRLDWPRAAAASYCCYLAVELFVKACILHRSPSDELLHHDVADLKTRYHELYPEFRYFGFQCPWDWRMKDIEKLCGVEPTRNYFDGKCDQAFRYFADRQGNAPVGGYNFAPGVWLAMTERFEDDFDRIWGNILEQASQGDEGK